MSAPRVTQAPAVGQVWQIDPAVEMFGGCFLIVSEVKSWGVQGYVRVPGGGDAFVRKAWDVLTYIGVAEWAHAPSADGDE